eukprot:1642601-Rhodomonas_salina.12
MALPDLRVTGRLGVRSARDSEGAPQHTLREYRTARSEHIAKYYYLRGQRGSVPRLSFAAPARYFESRFRVTAWRPQTRVSGPKRRPGYA